jgi:phage terminase small subunit
MADLFRKQKSETPNLNTRRPHIMKLKLKTPTTPTTARGFPPPPEHLSERAKQLWTELGPRHARSTQRRVSFQTALECLTRADSARVLIESQGLISKTETTGTLHINPAVRIEKESRQQFTKIWEALHLHFDQTIDGR